jgi:quinol monooxygenase YgiN
MIVLAVTWRANPGSEEHVAEAFRKLQEASRAEPGCLMFNAHRHKTDSQRFFVYEQYRDENAMDLHRDSPHFKQYVQDELPKLGVRVEGELYEPLLD